MWILTLLVILLHIGGSEKALSLTSSEYLSKETCESAGQKNVEVFKGNRVVVQFTCTPK